MLKPDLRLRLGRYDMEMGWSKVYNTRRELPLSVAHGLFKPFARQQVV